MRRIKSELAIASTGGAIAEKHYYGMMRTYLMCLGLWPYQTRGIKIALRCLMILLINSALDAELIKFIEVFGDIKHMLKCLPAIIINLFSLMKLTSAILYEDKVRKIFARMNSDWSLIQREEERRIMHECSDLSRRLNFVYAIYLYVGGLGMFALLPLMPQVLDVISPLNESRPRIFMTECEYFVDQNKYYYTILIHTCAIGVIDVTVFVAFDATFISIVQHSCALFMIASNRIKGAANISRCSSDLNGNKANKGREADLMFKKIVDFVHMHNNALEFAKSVESAYTAINLAILGYAILSLAVPGIVALSNMDDLNEMARFSAFAFASVFHLFCYNWLGQKVTNSSEIIYESAYECLWYDGHVSARSKLMLRIVMQRSLKSCKLTGGKVYELSYPNFASVVKAAMSYLAVLRSIQ